MEEYVSADDLSGENNSDLGDIFDGLSPSDEDQSRTVQS